MDDILLSTGEDLHMGAQGYVQQLGGSYLSVDLLSRKCYHFITVEQSRLNGSQGLEGVCEMQSDTIGGKGWLCCPEKGWKATFSYFTCPGGKSGKVRGRCMSPRGGEESMEISPLSFITSRVKRKRSYMTP